MSDPNPDKLVYEAVPGYRRIFLVAFAIMAMYLAAILVSSPGPAKGHGEHGKYPETESTHGSKADGSH